MENLKQLFRKKWIWVGIALLGILAFIFFRTPKIANSENLVLLAGRYKGPLYVGGVPGETIFLGEIIPEKNEIKLKRRFLIEEQDQITTPAWSPDKRMFAYSFTEYAPRKIEGQDQLWIMDLQAGTNFQITNLQPGEDFIGAVDWDNNGKAIYWGGRVTLINQINLAEIDNKKSHPIVQEIEGMGPKSMELSPDGTQIVYETANMFSHLWLVDRDGRNKKQVVDMAYDPHWTPDGKLLHQSEENPKGYIIYNPKRGEKLGKFLGEKPVESISFSPNGTQFIVVIAKADSWPLEYEYYLGKYPFAPTDSLTKLKAPKGEWTKVIWR